MLASIICSKACVLSFF
ncbi:uncharacterized protein FFE2_16038 [Fusarium fujikuroi]|nr:uncharacterized protein FFE2_16038 [Fusarium fujikuroi]